MRDPGGRVRPPGGGCAGGCGVRAGRERGPIRPAPGAPDAPCPLSAALLGSSVRRVNRGRRITAAAAAVLVLCEALAIATAQWLMGLVVRAQRMSMAGLSTDTIAGTTWLGGALLGGLLLACAVLLLRAAVRDRLGGRPARAVLASCLVVNAVLAVLAVGMVGWGGFTAAMVVFGLVLLVMTAYPPEPPVRPGEPEDRPLPHRPDEAEDGLPDRPAAPAAPDAPDVAVEPAGGPDRPAAGPQGAAAGEPVAAVSATDR